MVSLKMHTWFNIFSAENNEKNKKYIENTKLVFFWRVSWDDKFYSKMC